MAMLPHSHAPGHVTVSPDRSGAGKHLLALAWPLRPGGRLVVFRAVSFAIDGMLKTLWNSMVLNKILNFIPDRKATMNYVMRGGAKTIAALNGIARICQSRLTF